MRINQTEELSFLAKLRESLAKIPPPKTEESISLRVLVQILVILGIIATDVAAQTQISLWAVPMSIVGAFWSYKRRKKSNITAKFIIAMAMILVMVFFFDNLFSNLNDTRLVLAQLLIQLQVLHSFDLPRRKDLGYSMVIGLILMGVAGTVSQTLAFAPLLLLFLAIALPTLILDYRSRLGLQPSKIFFVKSRKNEVATKSLLSIPRLSLFLLIICILGLIIFAIMPRFSGYQLQSFPVNSPIELQNKRFGENRGIVNPGYGEGNNIGGNGKGNNLQEDGPGELDSTYYYAFNSKMNQNLRGVMKPKIVMRIRSQAPGFWRVLGFDRYTGQGWEISRNEQVINIKRPYSSYRFYLPLPIIQNKTKDIIQSYTLVSDLPNLIPALSYPKYIFFPSQEIAVDAEGGLRSPYPLVEGLTYTVVSQVPSRDRTLLGKAHQNYPLGIKNHYLDIPDELRKKIRPVADALLAKSSVEMVSPYEKALFLTQALKQNYQINSNLPFFEENEDIVEAFLFRYQGGYPDHFATALTMLLRSLDIPARVAVGFAPGQFNPFTGYYIVRNTDAYALTEVYFPDYGWFAFDPIPGHEIIPPSFEEDQTFGVLGQFWRWLAGWLPSPINAFVSDVSTKIIQWLLSFFIWLWGFFSSSFLGLLLGLFSLILLGFLLWIAGKQGIKWLQRRRLAKLPPMARLYWEMLETLQEKGYPKHPAQTPLEYAKLAHQKHNLAVAEIIQEICDGYILWRYGEEVPNITYLKEKLRLLKRQKLQNLTQ